MSTERALTQILQAEPSVRFALLFGSRASGAARPDSDWDVGIFLDSSLDARQRLELRLRLSASLAPETIVDAVVLNDAPPLLAHRALGGRLLLKRDAQAYVRFFVRVLAAAQDARHYWEMARAARASRLEEGRFGRP